MRPTLETRLRDWPWVVVRFRCLHCDRGRDVRLATLAAKFGDQITASDLNDRFRASCPRDPGAFEKAPKYGWKCTGHLIDLDSSRPPDLPVAQVEPLRLIRGGKRAKGG